MTTLITVSNQPTSPPNSCVQAPTRPYAIAEGAAQKSSASLVISSAGRPVKSATRSGGKRFARSRTVPRPSVKSASRPRRILSAANITWSIPSKSAASVPGRMK